MISVETVYETVPCPQHAKGLSRAAQVEPIDLIILRSSCALFRVYACYKKKPKKKTTNHTAKMYISVHIKFIIGLPNV